ncbi:MAG TPA: phosphoribosyl-ATP diphosphatase [Rectinemataceae bacterium]|nr:phosphoribosyl-ATP diphosphatase [Rectinemataceae bacterium]
MIIPSIDIVKGRAVQLEGGETLRIDAGDPFPLAEKFARVGEIAVIDIDAARGEGDNRELVLELVRRFPCRVGGGIRDFDTAANLLDAGARKIIIGTAAEPELLSRLPRERLIAALDARNGEVVVEGWRKGSGKGVEERMRELAPFVGGFLVTVVEREGKMGGIDLEAARELAKLAASLPGKPALTIAGGVTTAAEVAELDRMEADAQVGMALYSGRLPLAEAFVAPLVSDRADGYWPVVVCDEDGVVLGLVWASAESVARSVETGRGVYMSRKRGLWEKGASSGNTQELVRIEVDCDRDSLRYIVKQNGAGFCHRGTRGCFGDDWGLARLDRTIAGRLESPPPGSYTHRIATEAGLLGSKLREEAAELAEAEGPERAAEEAADLVYFAIAKLRVEGATLRDVERVLDRRAFRVTRRPGNAKAAFAEGSAKWPGIH